MDVGLTPTAWQAIGAVLSGATGILLAGLYYMQYQVQGNQEAILDRQTDLGELEHEPKVQMRSVDAFRAKSVEFFELQLANIGRGPAKDLCGKMEVELEGEDVSVDTSWHELKYRYPSEDPISSQQAYLQGAESQNFLLSSAGSISGDFGGHTPRGRLAFEYLTELISSKDVRDLHITLKLEYRDIEDGKREETIGDIVVPLEGRTSLSEAIRFGTTYEDYDGEYGYGLDRGGLRESREPNEVV